MRKVSATISMFLAYFFGVWFLWLFKINLAFFSINLILDQFTSLVLWVLGGLIGWNLLRLDRLVFVYFTDPENEVSRGFKAFVTQKRWLEAWRYLRAYKERQTRLAFRSVIFQAIWLILAIFAITSTTSFFGKGVVIGLGLHLLLDEWKDEASGKGIGWMFWQIQRPVGKKEQRTFLYLMTVGFGVATFLLI